MRRLALVVSLVMAGWPVRPVSAFVFVPVRGDEEGSTFVVSIGVERYDDSRFSTLRFADADARAVAAAFRGAGTPANQVLTLTSDAALPLGRPTRSNILAALENVATRAVAGNLVVLFFAGHGVEADGRQYLLAVDSRRSLLADTALPIDLVRRALTGIHAGAVLLIVDACRNDPSAGRGDADSLLSRGLASGLSPGTTAARKVIEATWLACDVGQRAYEDVDTGHGVFTSALLKGLSGAAKDGEGNVRLSALANYVQTSVATWARRAGQTQTPRLVGPGEDDIVLLRPPAEPVVTASLANQPLAEVVKLLAEQCGAQIVLGRGADPNLRVTGRLDSVPLGTALKALVEAQGLTVRRDGALLILEGGGPSPTIPPTVPTTPTVTPTAGSADLPPDWPAYLAAWRGRMPGGLRYRVAAKDHMPQVLIPAGDFEMGSAEGEGEPCQRPRRTVYVSAFWMDLHPVSIAQYQMYCQAADARMIPGMPIEDPLRPIRFVTWDEAAAYAAWAGRSLPTEAQWEKAARGGLAGKQYPWGNKWDATLAHMTDAEAGLAPRDGVVPGSHPPNGYGLFDMAGNVAQWCLDYFDDAWYARMTVRDPVCAVGKVGHTIRGSSFMYDKGWCVAGRWKPVQLRDPGMGFRCAQPAAPGD